MQNNYLTRKAEHIVRYNAEHGRKLVICTACNGSGHYDHNGSPPCGSCGGTGKVHEEKPDHRTPELDRSNAMKISIPFLPQARKAALEVEIGDDTPAHLRLRAAVLIAVSNKADLVEANLGGAYLSYANLSGVNLRNANLGGAYLSYANLLGADLRDTDLSGANLSYANLLGADLREANLRYANLLGANLSDSDLNDTNLRYAKPI